MRDSYFPRTVNFCVKQFTPFIPHFSPAPRFGTVGFWGQGPGHTKTFRSKGENQQQTQRSHSVTSGGIRTRGTLIGAAPHISFHLYFPSEKKKNFSFTRDLFFYRLFNQYFLFSTCSPCKQTNRNLRMWIFFCPLSCTVRNGTWDGSAQQLEN